jgi:hypothetical protein
MSIRMESKEITSSISKSSTRVHLYKNSPNDARVKYVFRELADDDSSDLAIFETRSDIRRTIEAELAEGYINGREWITAIPIEIWSKNDYKENVRKIVLILPLSIKLLKNSIHAIFSDSTISEFSWMMNNK